MTDQKDEPGVVTLDLVVDNSPEQAEPAPNAPPVEGGRAGSGPTDLLKALPPDCPVTPLGMLGDVYFYLDKKNQLRALKAKDHSRLNILALFGDRMDWLHHNVPRITEKGIARGWSPETIVEGLMSACARRGLWNAFAHVRGAGGWPGSNGELVMHCGDVVLVGGREMRPGRIGDYLYTAVEPIPRPALEAQEPGEHGPAGRLIALLQTWCWRRPETDPHLLLGWIVAAMAGGALDWRPLAWITGDKGTGKSTLQKVLGHVFNGAMVQASDATAAGIWQEVAQASLPIALDEAEAEEDNRRLRAIVKLARQAASGGLVLRGGADHTGSRFMAQSCFLFSSINVPPLQPADLSRQAVLELHDLPPKAPRPIINAEELADIGAGLRRRLVDHWPRMDELLLQWQVALADAGHTSRGADVFGTLLACADVALHDHPPDSDTLETWCERLDAAALAERQDNDADHIRCLHHLLTSIIDPWRSGIRRTVGSWIIEAAGRPNDAGEIGSTTDANKALGTIGLRVLCEGQYEARTQRLAVANSHQGLTALFNGTKWQATSGAAGGWVQALRRFDSAEIGQRMRFDGAQTRVTVLPIDDVIGPEGS